MGYSYRCAKGTTRAMAGVGAHDPGAVKAKHAVSRVAPRAGELLCCTAESTAGWGQRRRRVSRHCCIREARPDDASPGLHHRRHGPTEGSWKAESADWRGRPCMCMAYLTFPCPYWRVARRHGLATSWRHPGSGVLVDIGGRYMYTHMYEYTLHKLCGVCGRRTDDFRDPDRRGGGHVGRTRQMATWPAQTRASSVDGSRRRRRRSTRGRRGGVANHSAPLHAERPVL